MERANVATERGRNNGKKTDKTRRIWTKREDEVLMSALKDLVTKGMKGENGFRTDYLNKLEDAMKVVFPKTDIVVNPHITSKITSWRKSYAALVTAHTTTGVGFNATTNQLDYTDEQWEAVVKKDSSMRPLRYKEWPLFPDWIEVFGKDRATGEPAEDVTEMAEQTHNNAGSGVDPNMNENENVNIGSQSNTNFDDSQFQDEHDGDSTANNSKAGQSSSSSARKRKKRSEVNDPALVQILGDFCRTTGDRLQTISTRIGYEYDLGTRRQELFDILGGIEGLSMDDKLDAAEIITDSVQRMDIFKGLRDEARVRYVARLLDRSRA